MRHCILIGDATGDNRLTVAVASRLIEGDATVVLVAGSDPSEAEAIREAVVRSVGDGERRAAIGARALTARPVVVAIALGERRDLEQSLGKAVAMAKASCLLALSVDFEQNLRVAVVARRAAGRIPVVVRSFDPDFAHQLESATNGDRYVESAYSVAHLSAPSFVAAALLKDPKAHQLTMRVGVEYVSVYRIDLPEAGSAEYEALSRRRARRRGLMGRTPNEIASDEGCQVLARCPSNGPWACVKNAGDVPLAPGEQLLLGGPMTDVLNLALGRGSAHGHARRSRSPRPWSAPLAVRRRPTLEQVTRAITRWPERLAGARRSTVAVLVLFMVMTAATVWLSLGTVPGQMIYRWVGTALGNTGNSTESGSRDAVAAVGLATGGIMLGLLTSMMSAWFVRERIVEDVRRRARRMKRHVIIVGLDDVGIQVAALLHKLEIRSTVVVPGVEAPVESLAPDGRVQKLAKHTPVLTGELVEMLDHAQVDRARAVVACSEDNLVNVQACMRAKRGDSGPAIRMIARIFNDEDAETTAAAFQIDHYIAAVDEAAPAFADAVLNAGARGLRERHGDLSLSSIVWHGARSVGHPELTQWRDRGIRILALLREGRLTPVPVEPKRLEVHDLAVLAGPAHALSQVLQPAR